MEEALKLFFAQIHWVALAAIIVISLLTLGKGADWLVDEAVSLSAKIRIPKTIIGATILSLGTTTPEAAVSVLAAIQGDPSLALGNAVGSIIVDTGLILGLACLISPIPLQRTLVNRQGWLQLGSAALLVLLSVPWHEPSAIFSSGGQLSRATGFLFVALLVGYMILSIRWALNLSTHVEEHARDVAASTWWILVKLVAALAVVIISARILIPAVEEAAARLGVPTSIIAATIVAFGTSLPELVTGITASLRGHGELALGNVIGADILNVLFVAGVSIAVTPGGLHVDEHFFKVLYPVMLFILLVFRVGIAVSGSHLRRAFGVVLVTAYIFVTIANYAGH